MSARDLGNTLGRMLREILTEVKVRRVIVAGGDTSGDVASASQIESLEMIAPLTPGSPLCKVTATGSPADGIEMTFKGGQIGRWSFLEQFEERDERQDAKTPSYEEEKERPRMTRILTNEFLIRVHSCHSWLFAFPLLLTLASWCLGVHLKCGA